MDEDDARDDINDQLKSKKGGQAEKQRVLLKRLMTYFAKKEDKEMVKINQTKGKSHATVKPSPYITKQKQI